MAEMREAIEQGKFADWQAQFHANRARGTDWMISSKVQAAFECFGNKKAACTFLFTNVQAAFYREKQYNTRLFLSLIQKD